MSIRIQCETWNSLTPVQADGGTALEGHASEQWLFDDLESGALIVTRRRAGEQGTDRLDGLAVAANDPADIRLPHLEAEHGHVAIRDLRNKNLVRELNEVADNEFEELFHDSEVSEDKRGCHAEQKSDIFV